MPSKILFLLKYLLIFIKHILIGEDISDIKINEHKDIIVLGNGPSLNESFTKHKIFFDNKYTIAVNNFIKSEVFEKIKPEFYIITDSDWRRKNSTENSEKDNKNIIDNIHFLNDMKKTFIENMINKVKWNIILFIPLQGKLSNELKGLEKNKYIKIHYYVMNPINCKNKTLRHFLYKHNFGMPTAQTVLIPAIFLSLNMKFKNIYLLGSDHSRHEDFFVDEDNILYTKDKHFYSGGEPKLTPIISNGKKTTKMHEVWLSLYKTFKGHILLEEYAKYLGVKIYNASTKSYIDSYERYKIKC